jgi:transposase-like protein
VPLLDLLRNAEVKDVEFLREATEWLLQQLMEAEVSAPIGAQRYERSAERTTSRHGHRGRDGETRLGTWHRDIPKLGKGSDFPNFLEPRRRE